MRSASGKIASDDTISPEVLRGSLRELHINLLRHSTQNDTASKTYAAFTKWYDALQAPIPNQECIQKITELLLTLSSDQAQGITGFSTANVLLQNLGGSPITEPPAADGTPTEERVESINTELLKLSLGRLSRELSTLEVEDPAIRGIYGSFCAWYNEISVTVSKAEALDKIGNLLQCLNVNDATSTPGYTTANSFLKKLREEDSARAPCDTGAGVIEQKLDISKLNILLVDDTPHMTRIMARVLSQEAASVSEAQGPSACLDQAKNVDVILMDIQMPQDGDFKVNQATAGMETTKEIRRRESDGRLKGRRVIIAATSNATQEDRRSYTKAGMDDCISKPYNLKAITSALRQTQVLWQKKSSD